MAAGSTLHVLALCTGLFPAAAAIMASNITDLLKYGLEMVAMSVRLGHEIVARSQSVDSGPGSWAYSIIGVNATEMESLLTSFHEVQVSLFPLKRCRISRTKISQKIPLYKRAYVAVTSRTWVTLFGPPSTFTKLWQECPQLGLAPKLKLLAGGSVHAANLPSLNVERILGESTLLDVAPRRNTCCVSSSTCRPYVASDLRGLLRLMLDDIMKYTLRLTETVHRVVTEIRGAQVDLFVVGPTAHTSLVQDALQSAQISVNVVRSAEAPSSIRSKRDGSDLIAIVGMSGRFPGSESIQEFWNVLAQGRDLHEQVKLSLSEA